MTAVLGEAVIGRLAPAAALESLAPGRQFRGHGRRVGRVGGAGEPQIPPDSSASTERQLRSSAGDTSVTAWPEAPERPVRPTRWT